MSSRHTGPPPPCGHDPPPRSRRAPDPNSARSRGFDMRRAIESERRRTAMLADHERQYFEKAIRAERGEALLCLLADRVAEFISPSKPERHQPSTHNLKSQQE